MNLIRKFFGQSYYKIRIIITFCIVTIALVMLMSRLSYVFIRNIYLDQIKEQVANLTVAISKQIDKSYLDILELGVPTSSTSEYFADVFNKNISADTTNSIFLFNESFKIYAQSISNYKLGKEDSQLYLYRDEIFNIQPRNNSITSPFKGDDGQWYLLGFYRLNNHFWIGVRESAYRLEKVENFSIIFWYIGIGGILLSLITGWFLSRSITKPIDKLVKFSYQIGKGEFKTNVPTKLKGEIKVLADAMEKMSNDLSNNQKEKENMLAQIAHEIRNPLGGIELLTNLIKEDLQKGSINKEYLDRILAEINSVKSLISSYLNYSKPNFTTPSLVDLNKIVAEVRDILSKEIQEKDIKFISNFQFKKIWFDYNNLRQVLINLISNSIEATNKNGQISINSYIKDNQINLSVTDNGTGITQENLNNIFDPFFTTKKDGTGLGLSISKKLCEQNLSKLLATSNDSEGTIFIIRKEITNEV